MADRKTAKQISDQFIAIFEAQLNQTIPLLPKAFNRVIAKGLGMVFVVLFQFADFVAAQMFVRLASDKPVTIGGIEIVPLDEWGRVIGFTRGTGQRTEGITQVTVLSQTGSIPAGAQLLDSNTQQVYISIGETLLDAPTVDLTVRGFEYSTSATLYDGQVLSFVSAPPEVEKNTVVTSVTKQGADPEDTESWRQRQLEWWAARPQGGAYADYREWGNEVDGTENIYPFSGGTLPNDTVDGIAPQALLDAVFENIEKTAATGLADRRPVNCYVNVASIYRRAFDVIISGLNVPDIESTKTQIEEGLTNYFLDRENYIDGLSLLPRRDTVSDGEIAGVAARIASANGGTIEGATLSLGAPVYMLLEGQKAKAGVISFS
jgi:hypothetical protein